MQNNLATPHQINYALHRDGVFDEKLYLSLFEDIAEAVKSKEFNSGKHHWDLMGEKEIQEGCRAINLRELCAHASDLILIPRKLDKAIYKGFQHGAYLRLNPDVRNSGVDPLSHWLEHGRFEGRAAAGIAPFINRGTSREKLAHLPMGINIFGMNNSPTGLGKASRGYFSAMKATELPCNYHEVSAKAYSESLNKHGLVRKFSDTTVRKVSFFLQNADMTQRFQSVYDISDYDSTYKIGGWVWELPQFRSEWSTSFAAYDEIWVPTAFCQRAISALTTATVKVIPYVVEVEPKNSLYTRHYFGLPENTFLFSYTFDLSSTISRKNPYALIRAFKQAFKGNDSVGLVLKILASGKRTPDANALEAAIAGDNRIILIDSVLTDAENDGLKRCVDCFVSPHRSEGFGLNIAEMMLLGKPVIATAYSGNVDFFDDEVGYPIRYDIVELDKWIGPYPPGATWANPDVDDIARLMRHVMENPAEVKIKTRKAKARIEQNYSVSAISSLISQRLAELGLDMELPQWLNSYGVTRTIRSEYPAVKQNAPHADQLRLQPTISLIVPVYNIEPSILKECIESVLEQSYPYWELCMVDDGSTREDTKEYLSSLVGTDQRFRISFADVNSGISGCMNKCVEMASGEFLGFLDNDDVIHPDALLRVAKEINRHSRVDVIYSDEVKLDEDGQLCDSYYKPDYSPEHLESVMYFLHFFVVRKRLFHAIGGFRERFSGAQDYDLALRLSRATRQIAHIDEPLYCWRKIAGSASDAVDAKPTALIASYEALQEHAKIKYGPDAIVEKTMCTGIYNLRKYPANRPRVTLAILTDNRSKDIDGRGYINMIENFYASILEKTTYKNYEILIAANGVCGIPPTSAKLTVPTRVIHYKEPNSNFNFPHKMNWVVDHIQTEYFVILNDDMEVLEPKWLDYLMDHIQDPEVGAVGAKLITGLGTIQHAGVCITTQGAPMHIYHGFDADFVGYNGYTHVVRNFSAVTGACLATTVDLYRSVGGFDEALAIDYNDIDFCLKLRQEGYRIVFNPNAQLYHFENSTVQRTAQDSNEAALFNSRWSELIARDPYYSKNLSQNHHNYSDRVHVRSQYHHSLKEAG